MGRLQRLQDVKAQANSAIKPCWGGLRVAEMYASG
jgi:hypothetical protein